MSSVAVVGSSRCASLGVLIPKQRARVPARGQSLADACGMRTQNRPISAGVGIERHNRATAARTYDEVIRVYAGSGRISSFEFSSLIVAD